MRFCAALPCCDAGSQHGKGRAGGQGVPKAVLMTVMEDQGAGAEADGVSNKGK